MLEPLYLERGLAVFDTERFRVLGPPAGPAGVSSVDLLDGSTWAVDHFDPASFVQLEVDAVDPENSALLNAAFGGDGALFMVEHAIDMSEMDPLMVESARSDTTRIRSQVRPLRGGAASDAGRMVLLMDLAADRRLHPLARITGSLEAANGLALRDAPAILEPLLPSMLDNTVGLAAQFDDAEIELLDDGTATALGELFSTAQKIHARPEVTRSGFEELAQRVLAIVAQRRAQDRVADHVDAGRPDRESEEELLSAAPPIAAMRMPEASGLVVERVGDSLVEVTVTRSDEQRWVRVLHHESLVLLGQAPLCRSGLIDIAEVVVPADLAHDDLDVQVLDSTELSRLVDRPLDAVRAAISTGREAARASRLGDIGAARLRWERCAVLWDQAGDGDRAVLARELSRNGGMTLVGQIETVDRVAEALAGQM